MSDGDAVWKCRGRQLGSETRQFLLHVRCPYVSLAGAGSNEHGVGTAAGENESGTGLEWMGWAYYREGEPAGGGPSLLD